MRLRSGDIVRRPCRTAFHSRCLACGSALHLEYATPAFDELEPADGKRCVSEEPTGWDYHYDCIHCDWSIEEYDRREPEAFV